MDEEEDVKKITEFINNQKTIYQNNFQVEFQDFVSYKAEISDDVESDEVFPEEEEEEAVATDIKPLILSESSSQVAITALTEEERSVIESCTDPELKKLLILNRSKNLQLINFQKKIQDLIKHCEQEIEEKQTLLKDLENKQFNQPAFIWKLAAPYFKDKKFFACPLNEDTVKKRAQNELTVYDLNPPPKWTPIEFDRLINAVRCNYNTNRQNDILQKINSLRTENEVDDKEREQKIVDLQEQLEVVKNDDSLPSRNSNEFINWYKIAEVFLKDKHTASECKSVWHMLVHPDINKSEWTSEENQKLGAIVKRHSNQNWDEIAAELNTQRTGFITCLHYFSKLCEKFKKSKFTPDEDKFLMEVVECYKVGSFIPWNKVVCHFNNRTRHQLYHRYTYFLSQNHVKKGKFSEAEDILLMILVNKFGKNFKKCSEFMPHRSQVQLKSRYNSNLQRHIRKGTFTTEDDKIIYEHVQQHGEKSWVGLTEKLNRCNAQIRQRYKLIKTFLNAHPEASVKDIPKRKHHYDQVNEDQYGFLTYMAEQYRDADYIPTISMIEESLQVELKTPNPKPSTSKRNIMNTAKKKINVKNIDTMLIDFFSSSMKLKEQTSDVSEMNISEACSNVEAVLDDLGAKLTIPEDFECNVHLDGIDVAILDRISKKKSNYKEFEVKKLIPPNINTLVGLRSLIIKHKDYKTQQKSQNCPSTSKADNLIWPIEQNLLHMDQETREQVLLHRDLFTRRFNAVFNWSAILSLEKPNDINIPESDNDEQVRITPRTYRRKSVEQIVNPNTKRRKIAVSDLTNLTKSTADNSKLQLVDKSVVERLMQSRSNVSIVRIETCTGKDGIVRPVLQCASGVSVSQSNTQTNNEDCVEDEDLEDVQKLDVVLKSEVANGSSACTNDEYEAVQDDVQLLKEVLYCKQLQVKAEPDY